ncbi:hypothetical protein V1527DRAFT_494668 [Lipomyces starkeyi]
MEIRIEVEDDIVGVREVEEAAFPTKAEAALALSWLGTCLCSRITPAKPICGRSHPNGLHLSKQEGWAIVFVLGDPTYYKRFGFDSELAQRFTSPYAGPHLMALLLQPDASREGLAQYAQAFALSD